MRNGSKTVVIPFTLDELEMLNQIVKDTKTRVAWPDNLHPLFEQLRTTVHNYHELANRNPDSLGEVSMLNYEYQKWLDDMRDTAELIRQVEAAPSRKKRKSTKLRKPLKKTIDRVAKLEGGIPIGDPQDPEDNDG